MGTKYYCITCETPFVGEENDYYIATDDQNELDAFVKDCIYENGNEWWDESCGMDEEEYFEGCNVKSIVEITAEEFYEACPWERK